MLVRLSTRLNPVISAMLRSRLHWLLSSGLMLITVTGRKTGRRYTIPVGYHQVDDALVVMVGEAPTKAWWRNYRGGAPIEAQLRGKILRGWGELLLPGSEEFQRRADASFRRSRIIPWLFGVDYDRRTGLTAAQAQELGRHAAIVRITMEE